ncbi:MAG: anti-sigma F factor [Clostridia bacterium]|nr:anti-sigma F factor [Clostridia bacterium]
MKYSNEMTLTISALSQNESFIRSSVASFSVLLNPSIEEIGDIKTAVSEAITNCIVHAYKGRNGADRITVKVGITDRTLVIDIIDYGSGIDDVSLAMQPFFTSGNTEERSGMGFTVMQALMDELKVTSKPNKGTHVLMKKHIQQTNNDIDEGADA